MSLWVVFILKQFEGRLRHVLVLRNVVDNASVPLFRAAALEKVGLYLTRTEQGGAQGCEDWDLHMRIAEAFSVRVVPEYLMAYRQTESSMSVNVESMAASFAVIIASSASAKLRFAVRRLSLVSRVLLPIPRRKMLSLGSLFPVPPLFERSGLCQSGLIAEDCDLQDINAKCAQHRSGAQLGIISPSRSGHRLRRRNKGPTWILRKQKKRPFISNTNLRRIERQPLVCRAARRELNRWLCFCVR